MFLQPRSALASLALLGATSLQAALITLAPSGATTVTFTATGLNPDGQTSVVVNGVALSSSPNGVKYGNAYYNIAGGFIYWDNFSWVASNLGGTLRFDLGALFNSAGAEVYYVSGTMRAIAADGVTTLESYDLASVAPLPSTPAVNATVFRGIQRASADIRYLEITSFMPAHSLTRGLSAPSAVPEPGTYVSVLLGGLALALGRYKKK
jgi:hypothetical protein